LDWITVAIALEMKQAIAGVAPPELGEVTVMTVWPSIAALGPGRLIGRLCGIRFPHPVFNLGKLFALALIPVAMSLYLYRFAVPLVTHLLTLGFYSKASPCLRYRLTNKRLIVEKGLRPLHDRSIGLDQFDAIDIKVLPGQEWYPAGELIFRNGRVEVFHLSGVSRPEGFRKACQKSRTAYVAVRKIQAAK
jgi:hypothetical protein